VAPLLSVDESGADGKQQLQAVVDRTLQAPAGDQAVTYRRLLREAVPADLLSGEELDGLLNPASYLGQAAEISRRILTAFPDYMRPSTEPERNGDSRG
jgi:3-carboxy-cis,cis-muconate cycloisomerase